MTDDTVPYVSTIALTDVATTRRRPTLRIGTDRYGDTTLVAATIIASRATGNEGEPFCSENSGTRSGNSGPTAYAATTMPTNASSSASNMSRAIATRPRPKTPMPMINAST